MRKFLPIACLLTLLTGCATSIQVGNTPRSSIEERLLISSFERALTTLDTQEFKGKTVVFTIDGGTGKFVDKTPPAIGETNYDDYTVLVVIHFTRSDMETRKWDWQPGS